jgi:hypothetical protein
MSLAINPETKVAELLDAFPEAEEVLVGLAPPFKALRNPLLRRTVAKVTSLEQAARVGGVPVNTLVRTLREALGAGGHELESDDAGEAAGAPDWAADAEPAATLDADALLAAGRMPVSEAAVALAGMASGEVLLIEAPFQPAPLIDALRAKGHELYAAPADGDAWHVWVRRS